jgi:hypothetical protein
MCKIDELTQDLIDCALSGTLAPHSYWKSRRVRALVHEILASTEVVFAPYVEFGIPDEADEDDCPPQVPVCIKSIGYRIARGRTVIYYAPKES